MIYTIEDIDIIARFPYEQDKHFRLAFLSGEGTQENPYLVSTAEEVNLLKVCPYDLDRHFTLMADIDMSGFSYDAALIAPHTNNTTWGFDGTPFTGVFDGNGHTISHLTIQGGGYLGLFGQLEVGAEIKNLGVVDANITGSGVCIGGLVGSNVGNITASYSTSTVSGETSVGGLVGSNYEGIITTSYSTGTVSGNQGVGGLVGLNVDHITHCYSIGVVSGKMNIGGLVGNKTFIWGNDRITNHSFWDTQNSGQATSVGGTGLTTAEMQTAVTFLEAGWDFVDETVNGIEDIWWILEGQDYPRLWWEPIPGN